MDHPTAQHQEISTHSLENMMVCPKTAAQDQRKPRPQPEQALKCPRCDSTNTKFCYYNNYSLSQPRYFCKSCRRYWTQGGTLRNVPVGGGCRKNKRSSSTSSSSSKRPQDHHQPLVAPQLPPFTYDPQANDLSLAFARLHKHSSPFNDFDFSLLGMPNGGGAFGYNNSQNLYYGSLGNGGDDNNNMGGIENSGAAAAAAASGGGDQMRLPYDQDQYSNATTTAVTVTTMKQELFSGGRENNESRILWGYPNWPMNNTNNADSNMAADFDSAARESCWNGFNSSSWHGLLNSPLM